MNHDSMTCKRFIIYLIETQFSFQLSLSFKDVDSTIKIKMFQTVLANYAILDISPKQSIRPILLNKKVLMGFLMFSSLSISFVVYFYQISNDFKDYIECVTTMFAVAIMAICFGALVFKATDFFENIACVENTIEMSELTNIGDAKNRTYNFFEKKNSLFLRIKKFSIESNVSEN